MKWSDKEASAYWDADTVRVKMTPVRKSVSAGLLTQGLRWGFSPQKRKLKKYGLCII